MGLKDPIIPDTRRYDMPKPYKRGGRKSGGRRSSGRRRNRIEQLQEVLQRQSYDFIQIKRGSFYEV